MRTSASKAMRETFSRIRSGSCTRLCARLQRAQAQPPMTNPRATAEPRAAAFQVSPACTHW